MNSRGFGLKRMIASLALTWLAALAMYAQPGDRGRNSVRDTLTVNAFYDFPYYGIGSSGYSHGKTLYSELVQAADGNFYGTTVNGGSGVCADGFGVAGCGTIFTITPAGVQTVMQSLELSGTGKTVTLSFSVPAEVFDALAAIHDGTRSTKPRDQ